MNEIWDKCFLELCYTMATVSKDKHYQTGCVIVSTKPDLTVLTTGLNGPVRGMDDDREERFERPEKYFWTEHAERNAIYNHARNGGPPLRGATLYTICIPCMDCARGICQSGITEVVVHEEAKEHSKSNLDKDRVIQLFKEVGVTFRKFSYERKE